MCAGDGPVQELAVIHTLAEVPGARPFLAQNATREVGAPELFEGGSLTDVVAAASAAVPPPVGRWGVRSNRSSSQNRQTRVHVYHGICAWSEGQLEGVHTSIYCPRFTLLNSRALMSSAHLDYRVERYQSQFTLSYTRCCCQT